MNDLVSVIIPTYNRAQLLPNAIKSILEQTYKNLEIIVVDDCSDDETEDVLKQLQVDNLRYIRLDERHGANFSRNVGIKESNGSFIAFQDSDDVWHSDKLEKQLALFEKENADVVFCPICQHNGSKIQVYPILKHDESLLNHVLVENVISTQTLIGRKEVFNDDKFDNSLKRFQDWDLAIRLISKYNVKYVDEPLVDAFIMKDSISKSPQNAVLALEHICKVYKDQIAEEGTGVILEKKIVGYAIRAQEYNVASAHIESVFYQEKNLRNYIYLVLSKLHLLRFVYLYITKDN